MFSNGLPTDVYYYRWADADKLRDFVKRGRNWFGSYGQRKIASNYVAHADESGASIRLHTTDIYTVTNDGDRTVTTSGWEHSAMTRDAVTQLSEHRVLFYRPAPSRRSHVVQDYFVRVGGRTYPYNGEAIRLRADGSVHGLDTSVQIRVADLEVKREALAMKRAVMRQARATIPILLGSNPEARSGAFRHACDTIDLTVDNPAAYWYANIAPRWAFGGTTEVAEVVAAFEKYQFGKKNERLYDDFDVFSTKWVELTPERCRELGLPV